MRTNSSTLTTALALVVLAVSVGGCRSSSSAFRGQWLEVGGKEVIEFFEDGRLSITNQAMPIGGSWTVLGDGRVKIEASALGTTMVITGNIEDDTLVLRAGDKATRYRSSSRIKAGASTAASRFNGSFSDADGSFKCDFKLNGTLACSARNKGDMTGTYELVAPDSPVAQKGADFVAWLSYTGDCELPAGVNSVLHPRPGFCPAFFHRMKGDLEFLRAVLATDKEINRREKQGLKVSDSDYREIERQFKNDWSFDLGDHLTRTSR